MQRHNAFEINNPLRQALWVIRRQLGPGDDRVILSNGDSVAISEDAIEVDVTCFEKLIAAGSPRELEQAVSLYRGELLGGLATRSDLLENHVRFQSERLKTAAVKALVALVAIQQDKGATDAAIGTAKRIISIDPLSEETHRTLMGLFADQGQKGLALKQYEICREFLRSDLDVDPDPETTTLYQRIKSDQRDRGKSISRPKPSALPGEARSPEIRASLAVALVSIVAVLIGVGLWVYHWETSQPPSPLEASALPLLDNPSIAVLPFANLGNDPEQEYFADGITNDIITDLSKFSRLFVITGTSTFTYKGKPVKVRQVAEDLGVRYVLEGSVQRSGDNKASRCTAFLPGGRIRPMRWVFNIRIWYNTKG